METSYVTGIDNTVLLYVCVVNRLFQGQSMPGEKCYIRLKMVISLPGNMIWVGLEPV